MRRRTAELEDSVAEMWRVLGPGGIFFARLASTIGLEAFSRLGAEQLDPLETTVVQGMRSMTTWVLRKR